MKLLHPGQRLERNYGDSSLVVAAPRLWKKLPLEIRETVTIFRKNTPFHIILLILVS